MYRHTTFLDLKTRFYFMLCEYFLPVHMDTVDTVDTVGTVSFMCTSGICGSQEKKGGRMSNPGTGVTADCDPLRRGETQIQVLGSHLSNSNFFFFCSCFLIYQHLLSSYDFRDFWPPSIQLPWPLCATMSPGYCLVILHFDLFSRFSFPFQTIRFLPRELKSD